MSTLCLKCVHIVSCELGCINLQSLGSVTSIIPVFSTVKTQP